jgi:hypothetical protein
MTQSLEFVTAAELHALTGYDAVGAYQMGGHYLVQTKSRQVLVTQDVWCKYVDLCLKDGSTGNEKLYHEERPLGHLGFMPASELVNAGGAR